MRCTSDPRENLTRAIALAGQAADRGAQIICLQELFTSRLFLPGRGSQILPARGGNSRTEHGGAALPSRRNAAWSSSRRSSKSAARAFITTPPRSSTPMAPISGSIARCTSRTIRSFYEKFYFTPGDLGFRAWQTQLCEDRRLCLLGPVVSGGGPADRACRRGDPLLSHRHRLASGGERRIRTTRSTTRGKRSSVRTRSPMAATSPCPIASAMRPRTAARASSSGVRASSPIRPGRSWRKRPPDEEEILVVEVGSRRARSRNARTGLSSATAASMRTAILQKRFID